MFVWICNEEENPEAENIVLFYGMSMFNQNEKNGDNSNIDYDNGVEDQPC